MIQESDKKRREFHLQIPARYLLLLVTLFCVGLISLTYYTDFITGPAGSVAGFLVVPFQKGITRIGTWAVDKTQFLKDMDTLRKENEELREENSRLTEENEVLIQEKFELDELRTLYDLDGSYSSWDKVTARVISKDTGNFYHSFIINKGTRDGLSLDMNVIADAGLVGRIITIGPHWARVESIIDDTSNVAGMVLATEDNLIVSGDLTLYQDGTISFSKLNDPDDSVTVGAAVVTSNISDKYLPGILIGHISKIELDPNNLTKSGEIIPAANFKYLDTVLVIQELKQNDLDEESEDTEESAESDTSTQSETSTDSETPEESGEP